MFHKNPVDGSWTVRRSVKADIFVNISAQSDLDFDVQLLEKDDDGFMYPLTAKPLYGVYCEI